MAPFSPPRLKSLRDSVIRLRNPFVIRKSPNAKVEKEDFSTLAVNLMNDLLDIEPISVHEIRHTHASVLLYKKESIHYVSERLGHSDIETTLKEATHVL